MPLELPRSVALAMSSLGPKEWGTYKRVNGEASRCRLVMIYRSNFLKRFCNMDYLFLSSLSGSTIQSIVASYDVACQWYKNFWTHIRELPRHLQLPLGPSAITFKVPKFHLASHEDKCQPAFSFNFTKWVGVVNGEGVERLWSWLKGAGPSTTEMGPGNRRGTLDDLCGFSNWRKIVTMGM